jgi:SAM-dependent methyltransferase
MGTPPGSPVYSSDKDYYGATARYYDPAYASRTSFNDVPFYVDVAKSQGGRALEVACGTGRVLLPTAQAGVRIDGLDLSPVLLGLLKAKLEKEEPAVRKRVRLFEGDMRSFSLGCRYNLITLPLRSLQHLYTADDQLAAFNCVRRHLKPGGKLAFNVFNPDFKLLDQLDVDQVEFEWNDPVDPSVRITRSFVKKFVDKLNQFFEGEAIFRSYRAGALVGEERARLRMSYYTYPQIQLLLRTTGFKVLEEYGSFEREPIAGGKEMIIVAEQERS